MLVKYEQASREGKDYIKCQRQECTTMVSGARLCLQHWIELKGYQIDSDEAFQVALKEWGND